MLNKNRDMMHESQYSRFTLQSMNGEWEKEDYDNQNLNEEHLSQIVRGNQDIHEFEPDQLNQHQFLENQRSDTFHSRYDENDPYDVKNNRKWNRDIWSVLHINFKRCKNI